MKKYTLIIFLLLSSFIFAQDSIKIQKKVLKKHTIRLGVIKALAGQGLDVSYENTFSSSFSAGSNLYIGFGESGGIHPIIAVQPFARGYFTEAKEYGSKGFFAEVFMSLGAEEGEVYNQNNYTLEKGFQAAIGFGLGRKWINEGGFVLETSLGVGRKLINNSIEQNIMIKGDLYIGYTF